MSNREEIGNHYSQYFRMVNVDTKELKTIAYKLRYSVFHEEYGYHNLGNSLNKNMEIDEYDDYSLHSLLFHRPSNQAIGYIRLIPHTEKYRKPLPIKKYYGKSFDFSNTCLDKMKGSNTGELSRMAIISSFRQRMTDCDMDQKLDQPEAARIVEYRNTRFPINYLPMCLMLSAMHFAFRENMEYGFAMIEPRFAILLRHFGVQFDQIGKPVECFGIRAPYVFYRENTYKNLMPEFRILFDKISDDLTGCNKNTTHINAR